MKKKSFEFFEYHSTFVAFVVALVYVPGLSKFAVLPLPSSVVVLIVAENSIQADSCILQARICCRRRRSPLFYLMFFFSLLCLLLLRRRLRRFQFAPVSKKISLFFSVSALVVEEKISVAASYFVAWRRG